LFAHDHAASAMVCSAVLFYGGTTKKVHKVLCYYFLNGILTFNISAADDRKIISMSPRSFLRLAWCGHTDHKHRLFEAEVHFISSRIMVLEPVSVFVKKRRWTFP